METSKFVLKDNQLTVYALCCGYIQRATDTGDNNDCATHVDLLHNGGCGWDIKAWSEENGRELWETFESLTDARKFWKREVKARNLIKCCNQ